jgi:hypothetical protein
MTAATSACGTFQTWGGIHRCPLFGQEQTSSRWPDTSDFDPTQTSAKSAQTDAACCDISKSNV